MSQLSDPGSVDSKWISEKQHKLMTLYTSAKLAINEWADMWVLRKIDWATQEQYDEKLKNMNDLIEQIASIQRILEKNNVKNEEAINKLNASIGVYTDENIQLNNRLNSFKDNKNTNIEQLNIDEKLFVETMFMNLLYFFSIISMIIVVIQKVYGK